MKVKELDRTVNVAWSPATLHPILLATGTAAQQFDASFSTAAALEVYSLNLTEPGLDMTLVASTPNEHKFHKLAWGACGLGSDNADGIIVGGCDDGRVQMYNVSKLLKGENSIIARQDKHSGAVRAIEFNSFQTNLLATGASDSEIFIWDLNNTSVPMTPGTKFQPAEDVVWVAWNTQVQHILASTFPTRCVVWDLRKNEPIIKLSDSTSRVRWKVVAWNPDVATQLCLASEEDQSPVIQLWDLRFATSPIKTLEGHQRGVLSISWCSQDSDLLASCGKDDKLFVWNPNSSHQTGEIVCELSTSNQWSFEVSWCPRNPFLISNSSFDGHCSIYSLSGGQCQAPTTNKIADSFPGMERLTQAQPIDQPTYHSVVDLRKPPKWLSRPAGASFAFGGRLVFFTSAEKKVFMSQVVTEPEIIKRSDELEVALQSGQYIEYCQNKVASHSDPHTQDIWNFIGANFQVDSRAQMLNLLGFTEESISNQLSKLVNKSLSIKQPADGDFSKDNFSQFNNDQQNETNLNSASPFDSISRSSLSPQSSPIKISSGDDVDGTICKALLMGNIKDAVEVCLSESRFADALVLAKTAGEEIYSRTLSKYFHNQRSNLSSIISAVVTNDWAPVVSTCDVSSWKEVLAGLLTYCNDDELAALCVKLGERLKTEGSPNCALKAELCYICAGNIQMLADAWKNDSFSPAKIQDIAELVVVLKEALQIRGKPVNVSGHLAIIMTQYAEILVTQGALKAALDYLRSSDEERINDLRERLEIALGHKQLNAQPVRSNNLYGRQSLGNIPPYSTSNFQQSPAMQFGQYTPSGASYKSPASGFPPVNNQQNHLNPMYGSAQQTTPLFNPPGSTTKPPVAPSPFSPSVMQPSFNSPSMAPPPTAAPSTLNPVTPASSALPPPPLPASGSFSGGKSSPGPSLSAQGGVSSRSKYVVDPSVQSGYGGYRSQTPAPITAQPSFSTGPAHPGFMNVNQPAYGDVAASSMPFTPPASSAMYGGAQSQFVPNADVPPVVNRPYGPTAATNAAPPGWNDPPSLSASSRQQSRQDFAPQNPITHPLFGATPQEQVMSPPTNYPQMNGGYRDQFNATPSYQPTYQPQAVAHAPEIMKSEPEPPRPKAPIPAEHQQLQTVLEDLRNRCYNTAQNPQSKRKLEEISRKLETLYDALRESKLSNNTLSSLHQLVQLIQMGDYNSALALYTQLASGPDFAQIASFMPGIKILIQSALQMNIYLQ
ncbi:unnamed protein product [Bemisia tabaci]|uniref:Protein transport protein Sec31A n=1 Tax=Bemisia tabaci TaxID=7038 RepID=A0A9P0A7T0_BEMTA|nr:unnamed protein product [Bemisia tabaci]